MAEGAEGRVYRGSYRGVDVAIKVILRDPNDPDSWGPFMILQSTLT